MADSIPGQFIYSWKIKNFSMCILDRGEFLCSPWILVESMKKTKWRFQFHPRGSDLFEFPCFLYRAKMDEGPAKITISGDIGIIDVDGNFIKSKDPFKTSSVERGGKEGTAQFMHRSALFEKRDLFLPNNTLTIQCRIRSQLCDRHIVTQCCAVTDIILEKCSFQWNIRNFDSHDSSNKLFVPLPLTRKIHAGFYTSGHSSDDGWVKIVICNKNINSIFVKLEASLLNVNGTRTKFETVKKIFACRNVLESKLLMSKKQLFEKRNLYEKEDILTLCCEVTIADGKEETEVESSCSRDISVEVGRRQLYLGKKLTDVQLKVKGKTFYAHKSIISKSPVFQTMFQSDMTESQNGVVEIVDLDSSTLNSLLHYMYSGVLEDLKCETVLKLYVAAEKYQILKLKKECASLLKTKLSAINVCQILSFADLLGDKDLKVKAEYYIIKNTTEVLLSDEWKDFVKNCPFLASQVLLLVRKFKV